jgi:hypothetical protein
MPIGFHERSSSDLLLPSRCDSWRMGTIQLPPDFKEFFTLLNSENVEYLLVGGYAVIHYGYVRSTGDIDKLP